MMKNFALKLAAASLGLLLVSSTAQAQELYAQGSYSDHQANIENGELIFNAAGCATCHSVDGDDNILAGGRKIETKFGNIYAPNITAHSSKGTGDWSNATFLNAVLKGEKPDGGKYFGAVFPYAAYGRMSEEDALDMRGYIATLPESGAGSKRHEINVLNKAVLKLWSSDRAPLYSISDTQLARGQYLTEAVGHCAECHTPRKTRFGLSYEMDLANAFKGETGLLGDYSPDISADRLKSISPEAFIFGALAEGKRLNGSPMVAQSMRRIARQMANLSVEDRAAIFAYLSGAPVDVATLAMPAGAPEAVATTNTQEPKLAAAPDMTGAEEFMQRVEASCRVDETPEVAVVQNASAELVDPALQQDADGLIEQHCRNCHGPGTTFASAFLTGDIIDLAHNGAAVKPGNAEGSLLYESAASNRMPKGKKMTAEELATLAAWINALKQPDAPAVQIVQASTEPAPVEILPRFVGGSTNETYLAAVEDLRQVDDYDKIFIRYFSFEYMPLPKIDCALSEGDRNPVQYFHAGLNKLINSVSRSNRVEPISAVKGTNGALVRIDLRDYGWTADDWTSLTLGEFNHGGAEAGFDEAAWLDLAPLYPYSVDPSSDPFLKVLSQETHSVVPIMRADWFARFATEAPYYDMLLRHPANILELERRMGVDVDANIQGQRVVRAGFNPGASGVSDHNRLIERHELSGGGYYWKSYDFGGDIGPQSLLKHPDGPASVHNLPSRTEGFQHDGGEMIFTLPNGMQGYYLSTADGDRLLVGPTSVVSFRNKPIGKGVEITNARSCMDCHENGTIHKSDQIRDYVKASSLFSREQQGVFLRMYPENDALSAYYKRDSEHYLKALETLGATSVTAANRRVSKRAPASAGGGEIITYLADFHFDHLDLESVAREFGLTPDIFIQRLRTIGDPNLAQIATDWVSRLQNGLFIERNELEEYWAVLLPRVTDMRAYANTNTYVFASAQSYETATEQAYEQAIAKAQEPYKSVPAPAYVAPVAVNEPLHLSLSVPEVNVHVNDLLVFDISATRRCELQVFYIEEHKNIEELPQALLGAPFLEPGEVRRIPYPGSGLQIRFDTPGQGETMLAYCRENGLGAQRMTAQDALDFAKKRFQPLSRGIIVEAAKKVASDHGQSASNAVRFNVLAN